MRAEVLIAVVFGWGVLYRWEAVLETSLPAFKKWEKMYNILGYSGPLLRGTLGQTSKPLLLFSDRGGSCQLSIELFSRQRCPPGSWLSCLGSPLKGHVQLDVQEMELIWKCLNLLL